MASGRQHIISIGFTSYSWPALTNWGDNVKKTLHRRDLGCTSTLSVMLRYRCLTSGEIVQVLHVSSELSSCKWSLRYSIWHRWCGGGMSMTSKYLKCPVLHIIFIILPDTFSYNLLFYASFCGALFPLTGCRRKAVYFLVIFGWKATLNLESNFLHFKDSPHVRCITILSRWWEQFQTVSQSWKYQSDLMSTATCQRLLWSGGECNLRVLFTQPHLLVSVALCFTLNGIT